MKTNSVVPKRRKASRPFLSEVRPARREPSVAESLPIRWPRRTDRPCPFCSQECYGYADGIAVCTGCGWQGINLEGGVCLP